jgi:hypothetical protein
MKVPQPRGALSRQVADALHDADGGRFALIDWTPADVTSACADLLADDDVQLALWMLYELHYRGFEDVPVDHEWNPHAIALRRGIEATFEQELHERTEAEVDAALTSSDDLVEQIEHVIDAMEGPSLSRFLHRRANRDQVLEYLVQRSVYHLKESDPHSFVLARVDGPSKVALAELQYDEYGSGRPDRLHATLYGDALAACGLDRRYGAYIDSVPGHTLAVNNVMSLFALQRRLRGAALGHLTAFEATSSVPCRRIAAGVERVGLPEVTAAYFHEHVEADAVHEQMAMRDICGSLVEEFPGLRADVLFGVAACLHLDALAATELLQSWGADQARTQKVAS